MKVSGVSVAPPTKPDKCIRPEVALLHLVPVRERKLLGELVEVAECELAWVRLVRDGEVHDRPWVSRRRLDEVAA